MRTASVILLWLLGSICAVTGQDLQGSLRALLSDRAVAGTRIGVVVENLFGGTTLVSHQEDVAFIPASNMKLVAVAAALEYLGASHVFFTRLEIHGKVVDGELVGDLVVVGNGDPRFGDPGEADTPESWAAKIRALGIRRVRGDLVLVEQSLDREYAHPDWSDYNAASLTARPVAALGNGENVVVVAIRPASRVGQPGQLSIRPDVGQVVLTNHTRTVSGRSQAPWFQRARNTSRVDVHARIHVSRKTPLDGSVAVPDPPLFLGRCLRQALAGGGVMVEGKIRKSDRMAGASGRLVAEHRTKLVDLLDACLKESDNRITEILFKAAGAAFCGERGSFASGRRAAAAIMERASASAATAVYRDGSGLSRKNRLTPRQLAALLTWAVRRPYGEAFAEAMATGGEANTTLRSRFQDAPIKNYVRAKTGYLNGARALSGYLRVGPERVWVFSILVNGPPASVQRARSAMDRFIQSVWKTAVHSPRR